MDNHQTISETAGRSAVLFDNINRQDAKAWRLNLEFRKAGNQSCGHPLPEFLGSQLVFRASVPWWPFMVVRAGDSPPSHWTARRFPKRLKPPAAAELFRHHPQLSAGTLSRLEAGAPAGRDAGEPGNINRPAAAARRLNLEIRKAGNQSKGSTGALAGLAALLLLAFTGCRTSAPVALERYEYTQPEMGVPFRIVLYAASREQADAAAQAAFDRIAALNTVMSDYEYDSELSTLSRTAGSGQAVKVSDDLWRVLARAQEVSRQTDGAFDITVGPIVSLWRKARRDQALPEPTRLARALASSGWRNLQLDPHAHTARLLVPGMRLDLGAIAKGYAMDEALKVLEQHGVKQALVSGGGDMAVSDPPPGKAGWRIEIAPLDVPDAPPARFVLLRRTGLATSGDLFQHVVIDGVRYSHIVDPHTGIGLTDHSLVTVVAHDGMTADSLSTAISVLGPDRGLALADHEKAAVCIVRKPAATIEVRDNPRLKRWLEK